MKKRTQRFIAILIGVALSVTLAACGYHQRTPEERANYLVKKAADELELNKMQTAKLEKLKEDLLVIRRDFIDKREQTRDTVNTLLDQPTLDQQRILELVHEHTAMVNEKAPALTASIAAFYDSLTADQRQELRERIADHREAHGSWYR